MLKELIAAELLSDEVRDEVIDGWNKAVDIPLLTEKVERKIMIAIWTIVKASLIKKL
jgi:dephospho-CoA kinase